VASEARTEAAPAYRRRLRLNIVPLIGLSLVALLIVWLIFNLVKSPDVFLKATLIGVTNGSVYGLIALGYTLVYGILELINFAHGDLFMLGSMMVMSLVAAFGLSAGDPAYVVWPLIFGMGAVAMVSCGAINITIERIAYKPLRHAPRLAPLITAIAMSFILQNIAIVWKGPNTVTIEQGTAAGADFLPQGTVFEVGNVKYSWPSLIVVLLTIPVLVALIWLVQQTRQGKAMRATAQDREAAAMMGINVNRTISFTFLIAGSLAGAGGLVFSLYFTNVRFDTGFQIGLIAFTAAVLGGIGNLPGAVLGALLIGLVQAYNNSLTWHSPGSDWTQSIVFAILILILVFRPEGLLGERTPEGV
jgi:branched-chain amino acid transport system permease protein